MTPIENAKDLIGTIPQISECCQGATMQVPIATISALRISIDTASDANEAMVRLLAKCRGVVQANIVWLQAQADAEAVRLGRPSDRNEETLMGARALLADVEAFLGLTDD